MVAHPETTLTVTNLIAGERRASRGGQTFSKYSPSTGEVLSTVPRSTAADVDDAVAAARGAQPAWAAVPAVQRGMVLHQIVRVMQDRASEFAQMVAAETGKSPRDAAGETAGAIQLGLFFASEGQRLYGRTMTSGVPGRRAMTIRQPIGVAGLIVPANTPIANVAWKVFPALVCGNAAVLKSAEDTPGTAALFADVATAAGLPPGVLNVVHGLGPEAGAAVVAHRDVGVVSFTGSTRVGREIQHIAGERFARVSLELGGKNPFVVCDDAELEEASRWAVLSAFSNAGQRCASGSRIIVFDAVYDRFRDRLVERAQALRVGSTDADDYGPVINDRQLKAILDAISSAQQAGARVLTGGTRLTTGVLKNGWFVAPTLIEDAPPRHAVCCAELFGPVATLHRARDLSQAIELANDSTYGLTACIHTRDLDRALTFVERVQAGVALVNAGTYGSEPHMPFGGWKQSGNGTREPGTEALDVYSQLKNVYLHTGDKP